MGLRRSIAILALTAFVMALAAPAMAQVQGTTLASSMVPVEQSDKDMLGALRDTRETSTAASIIRTRGLDGIVLPGEKYTWFVASDEAMKALDPATRNRMLEKFKDRHTATKLVKGHMVSGMILPDEMTDGRVLRLMNGNTMTVSVVDGKMMVDDATISKAVQSNNGIIYVMDRIPSSLVAMWGQMGIAL